MTTAAINPIRVGDIAPDFNLWSTAGINVTLSSFRGQSLVLVAFFPLAFTSTCTAELCGFSEDFDVFGAEGVEVLPISVDAVPSLKEFRNKYDMKVHLLSDFRRAASRGFGVMREDTLVAVRSYFLIDQAGVVRWAHVEEKSGQKRENSEIHAAIKAVTG
ncbi:MAG: redoxin domain-containing protein [Gemmatimonadaceae bacterium]|nr:redoxin domain-containing protein [Gemmatimonadaceae bacterium]